MNLLFNSSVVKLFLKTNVGRDLMFLFWSALNCRWEVGEVGKLGKVEGW